MKGNGQAEQLAMDIEIESIRYPRSFTKTAPDPRLELGLQSEDRLRENAGQLALHSLATEKRNGHLNGNGKTAELPEGTEVRFSDLN